MFTITPLPSLSDNYIWVITQQQQAIVIDPAESTPVRNFLSQHGLQLHAILLTHNHADHTDGVTALAETVPNLPIYGSAEVAQFANHIVAHGSRFTLLGNAFEVIESGGHTAQHISYLMNDAHLFCGDALFSGGCGRVFTGDYAAQFATLQRFLALPDAVQAYPAHEYTQSNLRFAAQVLGDSATLSAYQAQVDTLRQQNRPTLPTTLGKEKQINPFLRAKDVAEFTRLRQLKDQA